VIPRFGRSASPRRGGGPVRPGPLPLREPARAGTPPSSPEGSEERTRVFAFVGPAGTGKSQRAQLIAGYLDVEVILDDGLVIRRGQIVCGRSAKAERNQVRAIRRAIFEFEDHRKAVADYLAREKPPSVLIIATSEGMAARIAGKLGLDAPERFIRIEDVATPEEIARAQRERQKKGQHVIPVSHVQVRKNFAGKLVGRLRVLWKTKNRFEGEKTIVRPPYSFQGEMHIEPEAVSQLASHVALLTPLVGRVILSRILPDSEALSIEIEIGLSRGGRSFVETARLVRRRVASSVRYFTGLEVRNVNVTVVEVVD